MSDLEVEVLLQLAVGGYVCSYWWARGRHSGDFKDFPATGKTTTWSGTQIDRYEGGKVVACWVNWDKYGFLEGLGLVS
ncbi:ester cyclase [Microbulbifer taiwanensis]|uniref:Ester cyclase n=1 Tax=Microbulbifer taiwanensis TaxID=986746 RepID=A0ABW1YP73_9GAMM|nr:ester cyclase [Microbulbifer taiwanensis]